MTFAAFILDVFRLVFVTSTALCVVLGVAVGLRDDDPEGP